MSSTILKPFQLLEINVISAQDLQPVSKSMKTYATAWIHKTRKLSTRVDKEGNNSPTWNDKFVFRVDEDFLRNDTSAVMIEIYSVHWFRDTLVGTVRILVGNLIPPLARPHHRNHHQHHMGMRFVALQVRRPSGRPQGILNIGVTLLDSSMRSMPLYTQLSTSAVGYRDLMGQENLHQHQPHSQNNKNPTNKSNNNLPFVKPILRRSRSERSGRVTFDDPSAINASLAQKKFTNGNASSTISGSESATNTPKGKGKKGKASSVISGAELRERPKEKGIKAKANSVISGSDNIKSEKPITINIYPKLRDLSKDKATHGKLGSELSGSEKQPLVKAPPKETVIGKPISKFDFAQPKGGKFLFGGPGKPNSIWSDSEVGPSPSEVAAAMAGERYPLDDNGSSVLDGWSLDESVEGLRSKLERWRTELPPLYDRGFSTSSFRSTSQHARRHTDGGSGLFSCFSNIYGYECQCICGKPTQGPGRSLSARTSSPAL